MLLILKDLVVPKTKVVVGGRDFRGGFSKAPLGLAPDSYYSNTIRGWSCKLYKIKGLKRGS